MNHLSKKELNEKISKLESVRDNLISLYLNADSLIKESADYIIYLLSDRDELQEEIERLREEKRIKLNVQEEFANIKAELRELEEKKGMENQNDKNI